MTSEARPEISIIIPIYNVEKYLCQCLDSIISQTLRDIEIILIDDVGSDNSMEIAHKYAEEDKRIRIINHKINRGASAARNTGIQEAAAPFIMFVDSDDYVQPDYCEKLLNAIGGGDLAICGISFIYEADAHLAASDEKWARIPPSNIKWAASVAWNKIYRTAIIREHDLYFPEGLKNEDHFFYHAYQPWCRNIVFIKDKLYNYRRRKNSVTNNILSEKLAVHSDPLKILAALGEYYAKHGLMRGEWGWHYWCVFDSLTTDAQVNRPPSMRPLFKTRIKRKMRRIWNKLKGKP